MDLFIFPTFFEGFGLVSLEAQTTELNIIQSDRFPQETHLTECVESLSLSEEPSAWAEKALQMPIRNRKAYNQQIVDTKYNLKNTISLISKLYEEMV